MRCALSYDEEKEFLQQKVSAWSELQPLFEEPAYKEEEIKDEWEKGFLSGYKSAVDDIINILQDDEGCDDDVVMTVTAMMIGNIAMNLFSILDQQGED